MICDSPDFLAIYDLPVGEAAVNGEGDDLTLRGVVRRVHDGGSRNDDPLPSQSCSPAEK